MRSSELDSVQYGYYTAFLPKLATVVHKMLQLLLHFKPILT